MAKIISRLAKSAVVLISSLVASAFIIAIPYGETENNTISELVKENVNAVIVITDGLGGQGSGFIIDHTGIIVTNYHVIKGTATNFVKLPNGSKYLVKSVIASEPKKDIAIVKINGWNLPTVPLGDSDKVQIGDRVVAIGSPRGLENTVSDGIVSSKWEMLPGFNTIQVTTPISPGSSGGALFNLSGEVIGITFAFFPDGQNLNFVVPINYVKTILQTVRPDLLKDKGEISEVKRIELSQQVKKLRQDYNAELNKLNTEIVALSKDTVRLKSGYEAAGRIIKKTDEFIAIETDRGSRMTFPMAQVDSIKQTGPEEINKWETLKVAREKVIENYENQFRSAGLIEYKGDWITGGEYRVLLAKKEKEEVQKREKVLKHIVSGDEYYNKAVLYYNRISGLGIEEQLSTVKKAKLWFRKALSAYGEAGKLYAKIKKGTTADLETKVKETKRRIRDCNALELQIQGYQYYQKGAILLNKAADIRSRKTRIAKIRTAKKKFEKALSLYKKAAKLDPEVNKSIIISEIKRAIKICRQRLKAEGV